jgi:hypothetical protein
MLSAANVLWLIELPEQLGNPVRDFLTQDVRMDRAYRFAYADAHGLQVKLGPRSRSAKTSAIAFIGFPTLLTVHQHRPTPPI